MATFSQIVDEVTRKLAGFTLRQDRQTYLISAIDDNDLVLTVSSANNISVGIIQIDDELLYVDSYDRNSGTLNIAPYGRGYNGTTAASHSANAKVVISPTFPRIDIKTAINETIEAVFPDLYVPTSYTFTFSPAKNTYALPSDLENVISVAYQTTGASREWIPIRSYRVDALSNTASFGGSHNSISLYSPVEPGRTVQVWYSKAPTVLDADADVYTTVTGLPSSSKDVIVLGAAYRLSSYIDPGRLTFSSAESTDQSQPQGKIFGAGTSTTKFLFSLYQDRLQAEARKLNDRNPIRIHHTR